jgi:hypothetical protein
MSGFVRVMFEVRCARGTQCACITTTRPDKRGPAATDRYDFLVAGPSVADLRFERLRVVYQCS